jgi:8-oxo-dGTP pyrophosphatase MutT (NUDIX family)
LIVREGKVLTLMTESFRDLPGGRIDGRESSREALVRELAEELPGLHDVRVGALLGCDTVRALREDISLFLVVYQADAVLPDPIVLSPEHIALEWIPLALAPEALSHMPIDWSRVEA